MPPANAQPSESKGESGPVAVPPPIVYLVAFFLGTALGRVFPRAWVPTRWSSILGNVAMVASILDRHYKARVRRWL